MAMLTADEISRIKQGQSSYTPVPFEWKSQYLPYVIGVIGIVGAVATVKILKKRGRKRK